jgi:hypothetical protein
MNVRGRSILTLFLTAMPMFKTFAKFLSLVALCLGIASRAMAQEVLPEGPIPRTEMNERRLDGVIRSFDLPRGTFVMDVTALTQNNGRMKYLTVPQTVMIMTYPESLLHVLGGDEGDVNLSDLHPEDNAIIIGTSTDGGKRWTAKEGAFWTRDVDGKHVLDGWKPRAERPGTPAPVPPGLVAWWKGDDTPADAVGEHLGILQNGAGFGKGVVGSAFNFDGKDDRLSLYDCPEFALTDSLSVEGWVFIRSCTRDSILFFRGDNRGGLDPYSIHVMPDGTLVFRLNSDKDVADCVTPVPMGRWFHLACTLDGNSGAMRIYIDVRAVAGNDTAVRPLRDLISNDGAGVSIGNVPSLPRTIHNFPFDGLVDELSLYNRALTRTEIHSIYDAGAAGKSTKP